ncbi:MAG TPA: hypothetical protein PK054_06135 [Anaerohalosphaeraceae bacterium]|nr:hypothetical protein [Anaerohalosphaeraceae bacterium]HOL88927.1 hypothetical protein [Anaerohalosphaeraceae bacterium]HPP56147.1 hypothetical protein [Anaerohalosphaeraceae bacterium]
MYQNRKIRASKHRGVAILAAMIFIVIFTAFSVGILSMASANLQVSGNHQKANMALNAALSGLEYAKWIAAKTPTGSPTHINTVTDEQADTVWTNLCAQVGGSVDTLEGGGGQQVATDWIEYLDGSSFRIRFVRYNDDPDTADVRENLTIYVECQGQHKGLNRTVAMQMRITKDAQVLNYAIAGRGRMWLAGNTTIHGDIYSSWNKANISPFNMTDDSVVEGSLNTVLPWQTLLNQSYQMQTFACDENGNLRLSDGKTLKKSTGYLYDESGRVITNSSGTPLNILSLKFKIENGLNVATDTSGNPIIGYVNGQSVGPVVYGNPVEAFDADGNRIYGSSDELKGTYETVNYSQPDQTNMPGLSINDYYDASGNSLTALHYKSQIPTSNAVVSGSRIENGKLSTSSVPTVTEYFPHAPLASGGYSVAASSSSLKLTRYKYENKTLRNVVISGGTNALFKNCTFEGILYVDCSTSGPTSTTSTYNNIRFENCTFNGTIVTNVPKNLNSGWWQRNCLYFTGEATFNNTSGYQEATILAPHFNVNLGNTNPTQSENNVLTGAIVGGIVDVRGNAQIYGTIISMADTTAYTSGYVTNIGATESDGGSETTEAGDIGVIEITPNEEQMLPSGITTPIVLKPLKNTYEEKI